MNGMISVSNKKKIYFRLSVRSIKHEIRTSMSSNAVLCNYRKHFFIIIEIVTLLRKCAVAIINCKINVNEQQQKFL